MEKGLESSEGPPLSKEEYPENKLFTKHTGVFVGSQGLEGPRGTLLEGEKRLEREKGPSLSKEEWERISASIYGFATTELNLKRPLK